MRPIASEFITPETRRAARHLGDLVRGARLARRMPQTELAARARTSKPTLIRIEKGGVETALGTWLAVMEQLGMLDLIAALEDPKTIALSAQNQIRRARRSGKSDLDF